LSIKQLINGSTDIVARLSCFLYKPYPAESEHIFENHYSDLYLKVKKMGCMHL
jgi:hypothetical protein